MATETAEIVETPDAATSAEPVAPVEELVLDELLVEEISIDGMCGVY
jgi:mycofactocin precursor